jgi:hypothetical protein
VASVHAHAPLAAGVGFRKPHLSWRVPHRFYTLYENATIDVAKVQTIGEGVPVLAYEMNGEMGQIYKKDGKKYQESPDGPPLPTELQRALRHGYCESLGATPAPTLATNTLSRRCSRPGGTCGA